MDIDLFAGVPVTDYERGITWWERLLGKPAAFEAHATESVWEIAEHRYVYVVLDATRAGHAMVTMFLGELDDFIDGTRERGIFPMSEETYDNGVRKVTYSDPDGNEIGFGGSPG